jgi:lipopolysaccharide transport system ATP-binding protein
MSDDVLVRVDNVSKRFCRSLKRSLWYGLQDLGSELGGRRHGGGGGLPQSSADVQLRPDEFWAVKDVSFELRRGECLGLIGRNGAGKTTLLRLLNGLIKPDTGRIEMRGRVGALIALGAGFNPILSGRENIYTNASVLGIRKEEVDGRMERIIDFSEISDFIDAPVQTYSSGMQVRLGFAVATALEPDILILDEVLAVGDSGFRFKCYETIDRLLPKTAVIFVSHNMPDVGRICTEALYMTKGATKKFTNTDLAVEYYNNQNLSGTHSPGFKKVSHPIASFDISCASEAKWGGDFSISYSIKATEQIPDASVIIDFFNQAAEFVGSARRSLSDLGLSISKGDNEFVINIRSLPFKNGRYAISSHILSERGFVASHSKLASTHLKGGVSAIASPCYLDVYPLR